MEIKKEQIEELVSELENFVSAVFDSHKPGADLPEAMYKTEVKKAFVEKLCKVLDIRDSPPDML